MSRQGVGDGDVVELDPERQISAYDNAAFEIHKCSRILSVAGDNKLDTGRADLDAIKNERIRVVNLSQGE